MAEELYPDAIIRQATEEQVGPTNTTATEANPDNVFAPVATYTQDSFYELMDLYRYADPDNPLDLDTTTDQFVQGMVAELAKEYDDPAMLSLETLRDGTAGVLDLFPSLRGLPPEERQLNNNEILTLFAYDQDGRTVQNPTFMDGVKRKLLGGTAAVPAFIGGMKATNLALSPIPPATPVTAAIRIGGPFVGGLTSAITAQMGGDYITEALMGPEPLMLPGTTADYVSGQVLAETGPSFLLGYGAARNVDLGVQKLLQGLQPKSGIGPAQRTPRSARFTGFSERFVERLGRAARGEIDPDVLLPGVLGKNGRIKPELLSADGKTPVQGWDKILKPGKWFVNADGDIVPKAGVVPNTWFKRIQFGAAEGTAIAGTSAAAGGAEEVFPGQSGPRFVAELAGGVSSGFIGDFVAKRMVNGLGALYRGYKTGRKEGIGEAFRTGIIQPLGVGNQVRVDNYLAGLIEKYGGDTEAILRNLDDDSLAQNLVDDLGRPIDLNKMTGGMKSRFIPFIALEENLAKAAGTTIGGKRDSANRQLIQGQKNLILALFATGNPDAIQEASILAKNVFEAGLISDLERATNQYRSAFQRLASGDENVDPAQLNKLGEEMMSIVRRLESTSRGKASYLWNQIDGDIEISSFIDASGKETNIPNFVSFWDKFNEKTPEAVADLEVKLKPLIDFTNRRRSELNIGGQTSIGTPQATLNWRKIYGDMEGMETRNYYDKMVANVLENEGIDLNVPSDEAITKLAQMASQARGRRRRDTDLSRLYNARRLSLIAERDAAAAASTVDQQISGTVTARELEDMRSTALSLGKTYSSGINADDRAAALAYGFAAALLRDLESFPEGSNIAYDLARAYSRAHHDVFTRAYAGDLTVTTPIGGVRIEPEQIAKDLAASDGGYLKSKELDMIGQNMISQSLTTLMDQSLRGRGDELLAEINAVAMNPETGMYDIPKLREWISQNRDSLEGLPGAVVRGFDETSGTPNIVMVEGGLLEALEEGLAATTDLRGTTESMLRSIRASGAWNDADDTFNPKALSRWMSQPNNKLLLEALPDMKRDLEAIVSGDLSAAALFKRDTEAIRARERNTRAQLSFFDLLAPTAEGKGIENPVTVLGRAISANQPQPEKSLNNLWSVVENAPKTWTNPTTGLSYTKEEAIDGFRSALLNAVFSKAGNRESFSARTAYLNLFAPLEGSKNSNTRLAEWMVDKGLFSQQQMFGETNSIQAFMREMVELEASVLGNDPDKFGELVDEMGPSADLILGILGVKIGNRIQDLIPGQSGAGDLIIAGKSAAAARTIAGKISNSIPNSLRMDLLERTLSDRKLLAAAVRRGKTEQERKRIGSRLLEMLTDLGFSFPRRAIPAITSPGEDKSEVPAPPPAPLMERVDDLIGDQSSVRPEVIRPEPIPTQPVAQPTTTVASAAPAQQPAPSGPVDRGRYAALFPNDMASGMIKQEGIGSLFG